MRRSAKKNPTWLMHRSRRTGQFTGSRRAKLIRAKEENHCSHSYMTSPYASNPELLLFGNPGKRRLKLKIRRKRKHGQKRIKFRGKLYYRIQLIRKFGKLKARKIWGKKHKGGSKKRRALPAPKSSWKALVKRYGVKGAKRHYHRRKR